MAYDEMLAALIREALKSHPKVADAILVGGFRCRTS
jgi:hypothetical protein